MKYNCVLIIIWLNRDNTHRLLVSAWSLLASLTLGLFSARVQMCVDGCVSVCVCLIFSALFRVKSHPSKLQLFNCVSFSCCMPLQAACLLCPGVRAHDWT